jgi:hypothetical protein
MVPEVLVGSKDMSVDVVAVGTNEDGTLEVKSEFDAFVDDSAESVELAAALDVGKGANDDDTSILVLPTASALVCVDETPVVGVASGDPELATELDRVSWDAVG